MHRRTISLRTIGFATCIFVASAVAASSVGAQVVPAQTFTAPGIDASPQQSANCNTGVLQVSGTGSWTVVPQGSNDNGVTYVTIPTIGGGAITGSGTFSGSVAGYAASFFRFNVSAVSGSVTVTKSCTSQILPTSGGGGSYTAPPVQAVAPAPSSSPFSVAIVSGGGTGGGAAGAPGSAGATAQYVQGVSGGYPIPVSGTFSLGFPYGSSVAGQTATANSFLGETCVYSTSTIALTNGQVVPCVTDAAGNLLTHINYALPSGTNNIGFVTLQGPGTSSGNPLYVSGGGGGSSTYPYGVASAAPTANSFVGISGYDGTNVRPVSIDPTTGYLLTKNAASVNGTYGAPNTTVTASATSVQYEQGTGPNGTFNVNLGATPQPVSGTVSLGAGAATIGSIGNTAFGITGAGAASGGPQTATSIPAIATGCIYNSATPAPTTGQYVPLQCSASGGLIVSGSFTATTSFPYSLVTQGQTATNASGVGVLGVYNSTSPTLTNTQAAPLQLDSSGNLNVNVKATTGTSAYPYSATTSGQTATTASVLGVAGVYNSTAPTLSSGQVAPLQLNASGALQVAGSFSASLTQPYTSSSGAQTAASNDGSSLACIYLSAITAGTSGQMIPCKSDPYGGLHVDLFNSSTGGALTSAQTTSDAIATQNNSNTLFVGSQNFGFNGTTFERMRTATVGNAISAVGVGVFSPYVQYNSTLPTLTTGTYGAAQASANGIQYAGAAAVTGQGATRFPQVAITTNAVQSLCASACTAFSLSAINTSAALCYIQEFNAASGSVTLGTTAPVRILVLPASAGSEASDSIPPTIGENFSTAWSAAATTTPTGSTACGSTIYLQGDYK